VESAQDTAVEGTSLESMKVLSREDQCLILDLGMLAEPYRYCYSLPDWGIQDPAILVATSQATEGSPGIYYAIVPRDAELVSIEGGKALLGPATGEIATLVVVPEGYSGGVHFRLEASSERAGADCVTETQPIPGINCSGWEGE